MEIQIVDMNADDSSLKLGPQTVEELLTLFDASFVSSAYMTILGREPDLEGFAHYLERIRAGHSKESVIASIGISGEAQKMTARPPDLDRYLSSKRQSSNGIVKSILNRIKGHPHEQELMQLRSIENLLSRILLEVTETLTSSKLLHEKVAAYTISHHRKDDTGESHNNYGSTSYNPRRHIYDSVDAEQNDIFSQIKEIINI